jgi:cob(I)alamin adenosyltransferase
MKIYTTTGDEGETSLFGGRRVPKDALRIETYGTVDELNSSIGVARSWKPPREVDEILGRIQSELFVLGADLATPAE